MLTVDPVIVMLMPLDWVPPGLVTKTVANPGVLVRLGGTAALSWLPLRKFVWSVEPFQDTKAPD